MTTGVYKITNLVNGKVYIGASKRIETRFWEHKRGYTAIADDLEVFGLENFKFEVLIECPEDMLCQWERDMICLYDSDNPEKGYNDKSDRPYSLKNTRSHKGQKAWNKGKPAWNKGKPGSPLSEEHKRKISEANRGKHNIPCSEEAKRKISEAKKGRPGTPLSEEHKRKLSETKRLYWQKKKESICL